MSAGSEEGSGSGCKRRIEAYGTAKRGSMSAVAVERNNPFAGRAFVVFRSATLAWKRTCGVSLVVGSTGNARIAAP